MSSPVCSASAAAAASDSSEQLVEVVSCKFLRYNCDHPVFQKEYTRSNRRRKTKILRCFPHCCPEHIPRCYCGCSIHILVTFKDASIVNDSEIIICARFEASSDDYQRGNEAAATRALADGELVVLPSEMLQPMPQDSVESLWIRAYREGESKQQSVPENSILYVMNNYRFPKWYYGYESGATKSQREMKHYLRAYVLRLERPRDHLSPMVMSWGGSWIASVVARHSSPGFTLISYRRAGESTAGASKAKRVDLSERIRDSSTESECHGFEIALPSNRASMHHVVAPLESYDQRTLSHRQPSDHHYHHDNAEGILLGLKYGDRGTNSHFLNLSSPEDQDLDQDNLNPFRHHHQDDGDRRQYQQHSYQSSSQMAPEPQIHHRHQSQSQYPQAQEHSRLPRDVDEKLFWRHPKFANNTVERARQLSVLQFFVAHVARDELWNPIMDLEGRIRDCWIESSTVYNTSTIDPRSRELLAGFRLPSPNARHHSHQFNRQHEDDRERMGSVFAHHPVLALCAEAAVEFATSRALQAFILSTLQIDFSAIALVSENSRKLEVRHRFAALVDGIYTHANAFLADRRIRSVAELVDELVTLVHQNQRFRWMQPSIRELLEMATPDRCAFEAFCAQAREVFIPPQQQQQSSLLRVPVNVYDGEGRRWSRQWLLNSRSLRVRDVQHHDTRHGVQYRGQPTNDDSHFSAWDLLSTIQQFGAIDMELDSSASLRMRSLFCCGSNSNNNDHQEQQVLGQPMHLLLDGKYRIFRTFPNGVSTMASMRYGWVYGDYFGFLEGPHSIKIWFFAFRNQYTGSGGSPARCISVHLTLAEPGGSWQSHYREGTAGDTTTTATVQDQLLLVSVKVDDAMCPPVGDDRGDGDHLQDLMTMASGTRHALWKTLHWKPSAEFEVEYQHLLA